MARPLVSVVIPTYNRLLFLREAVQSVIAQTFEDWELIVVDDGSTDSTVDYVEGIDDPRIRVLAFAHGGNIARVRNLGVRAATGDFVAFLDSDDVWMPQKLQLQLAQMKETGAAWSYSRYEHMSEGGAYLPFRAGSWEPLSGNLALAAIEASAGVSIVTVVVERAVFREIGGFDEMVGIRDDYDFVLRLALHANTIALPQVLVRVRDHAGRTTWNLSEARSFLEAARVYDKLLENLNDPRLRRAARQRRAYHLSRGGARQISQGSLLSGSGNLFRSVADWLLSLSPTRASTPTR